MTKFTDKKLEMVFRFYPAAVRRRLLALRELVFEVAAGEDEIGDVTESLKWGEPSYCSQQGSAVRIGWKEAEPERYRLFFHCQTSLIETFRILYPTLTFEGNRAIVFQFGDDLRKTELSTCIQLALTYHRVKHLELLGASSG